MGRLEGKVALLTGATGNIGQVITRRFLQEGARVAISGRTLEKLNGFKTTLVAEGFGAEDILPVVINGSDLDQMAESVATVAAAWGPIHVLINNAGSAGAKQPLERIPFTAEDLADLKREGFTETESMVESAQNLLGLPWNLVRVAYPHLAVNASVINVSTIFSRANYYGRIPYVVPKSALNALSLNLAKELGVTDKALRVNTVFPGPIDSDRIRNVFQAMDALKGVEAGTTAQDFFDIMILKRERTDGETPVVEKCFPKREDVANTIVFLGSDESAAMSGHNFEVTHGMQVKAQSRTKLVAWPDQRLIDLTGRVVLVSAGDQIEEALAVAHTQRKFGARVILTFRHAPALKIAARILEAENVSDRAITLLDPLRRESAEAVYELIAERYGRLDTVIFFPAHREGYYGKELLSVTGDKVQEFIEQELIGATAFASYLSRFLRKFDRINPLNAPVRVLVITNGHDGYTSTFEDMYRAGIEQLIRVWRHEEELEVAHDSRRFAVKVNQLVRYSNNEPDNLKFTADWAATLSNQVREFEDINLYLPDAIQKTTGKSELPADIARVLLGLHIGKVAVITGGSSGIGGQIGHYLALAGARVLLAARDAVKLNEIRDSIINELKIVGYPKPEDRIAVLPDTDVGDEDSLQRLFDETMKRYGRIDYLINNAGIAGAEEMVVDLKVKDWRHTLKANLISNYSMIYKVAPAMKRQGFGYILNVSSYFGGEKYVAVPYPNRSDYAVSKAGQRALAEILARHLGPEIQINAISPGPVQGERLRGKDGKPGLYLRRGKLILDNRRLNEVHAAVIEAWRKGHSPESVLLPLKSNRISEVLENEAIAPSVRSLLEQYARKATASTASGYLLDGKLARKLLDRLLEGGYLGRNDGGKIREQGSPEAAAEFIDDFLKNFPEPPEPFFHEDDVMTAAIKVQDNVLSLLHLHHMPTEQEVALATVFYLADRNVSGETFHPSGGLKFDRAVTEGELYGRADDAELMRIRQKNVLLVGDNLEEELRWLISAFAVQLQARNCIVLTKTAATADRLRAYYAPQRLKNLHIRAIEGDIEAAMDRAMHDFGQFNITVSMPFDPLPVKPLTLGPNDDWRGVLNEDDFDRLVEQQVTHHFRIARKAALQDKAQIVIVTPKTSHDSTREEFALALFAKTSLHALTATLAVESERFVHFPTVNQVDLTRRARVEEPRNAREVNEELERFVNAVLLSTMPAPAPEESRYLARIYRGNAITV